jgi:hypothetical protein
MHEGPPPAFPIRKRTIAVVGLLGVAVAGAIAAAGATFGAALVGGTSGALALLGVGSYEARRRAAPGGGLTLATIMLSAAAVTVFAAVVIYLAAR